MSDWWANSALSLTESANSVGWWSFPRFVDWCHAQSTDAWSKMRAEFGDTIGMLNATQQGAWERLMVLSYGENGKLVPMREHKGERQLRLGVGFDMDEYIRLLGVWQTVMTLRGYKVDGLYAAKQPAEKGTR